MPSANQNLPTATESDADPRELVQEEIESVAGATAPIKPQSPVPDPFPCC